MTIWKQLKKMSKEEFAEWLFANCEYIYQRSMVLVPGQMIAQVF